jgi:hypothetical protein
MFRKTMPSMLLAFGLLLQISTVFSQVQVLGTKGDTQICFTIPQSKFLLKEHHRAEECDTLKSICETQLSLSDSALAWSRMVAKNQALMLKNNDEAIGLYKYEIDRLRQALKDEQRKTKAQRFYKWCAIVAGSVGTGYMSYKYITK